MTIWKYVLRNVKEQEIEVPSDCTFLTVQIQNDNICLWAEVDPDAKTDPYIVEMFGAGDKYSKYSKRKYVGTVMANNTRSVKHVFAHKYELPF